MLILPVKRFHRKKHMSLKNWVSNLNKFSLGKESYDVIKLKNILKKKRMNFLKMMTYRKKMIPLVKNKVLMKTVNKE